MSSLGSKPDWAALFILGWGIHITYSLKFTSSATTANLLPASMAGESFSFTYLFTGIGGAQNWDLSCHHCLSVRDQALLTELCRLVHIHIYDCIWESSHIVFSFTRYLLYKSWNRIRSETKSDTDVFPAHLSGNTYFPKKKYYNYKRGIDFKDDNMIVRIKRNCSLLDLFSILSNYKS